MKKKQPKLGDTRIVKKFAFFPTYVQHDDETYRIFFENYLSYQKYSETYKFTTSLTGAIPSGYFWIEFYRKLLE